ncbi:hypothetical protein E4U21_004874 [Claviceps maximensis]|nr:hypothetical protein E4U21_004874 [Claviceps maximensis]
MDVWLDDGSVKTRILGSNHQPSEADEPSELVCRASIEPAPGNRTRTDNPATNQNMKRPNKVPRFPQGRRAEDDRPATNDDLVEARKCDR